MVTYANVLPSPPTGGFYEGQPASSGVNHLIAAAPNLCIAVVGYALQATGTVNVNFQDTNGNALSPAFQFQAREGIARTATRNSYLFITAPGVGLDLNLSAGVAVNCDVEYVYLA